MSIEAAKEYLIQIWERYRNSSKKEKQKILNEFCSVCGYSRKYAIRILSKNPHRSRGNKPGPKPTYNPESLLPHLKTLWFQMEQMGAKKMVAALPHWLPHFNDKNFTPAIKSKVLAMSASTIDRLLKPIKGNALRGLATTKPGSLIKKRIPIQTVDWNIKQPGFLEADTVAHCGDAIAGEYAHSVTMTDIHSGWTENRATWTKASGGVQEQIKDIEKKLPFDILGFDCDNGSEFLTYNLMDYFLKGRVTPVKFTRSRPYQKNDQAYVEQKNWTHVRQLFGYDRLDGRDLVDLMNDIYKNEWNLLHNYFIPQIKLIEKIRFGGKIKKKYDKPKTPYQRILDSADIDIETKQELVTRYRNLNPFELKARLEEKLKVFSNLKKRLSLGRVA